MQWRNSLLKRVGTVWALLLPFWIALYIVGTLASYRTAILSGRPVDWGLATRWNLVGYADWALVLTPVVLFLAWRFPFERKALRNAVPIHLGAMFCLNGIDSTFSAVFSDFTYPNAKAAPFRELFERYFFRALTINIWLYWGVAFTALVIAYYLKFKEKEIKAIELETQLARAQLSILRMQLQPHFLFNALHSISALMHQNVKAADKMIACLGDLLRMSIAESDANEVTLKQELEFLEKYIEIQKLRFQEQLSVAITVEPDALTALVPRFLLQPLVENAIKHGTSKRTAAGRIDIEVHRKGERLHLKVTNDVPAPGLDEMDGKDGLGLGNMKARLHTLYGDMQHLEIASLPGPRVAVDIVIPLRVCWPSQNCTRSTGEFPDHI